MTDDRFKVRFIHCDPAYALELISRAREPAQDGAAEQVTEDDIASIAAWLGAEIAKHFDQPRP
jgi:hypothetical protein